MHEAVRARKNLYTKVQCTVFDELNFRKGRTRHKLFTFLGYELPLYRFVLLIEAQLEKRRDELTKTKNKLLKTDESGNVIYVY